MRTRHYLLLLVLLPVLGLLGCGGGGDGGSSGSGSMSFAIHFPPLPADAGAKYLPSVLMSVVIDVLEPGSPNTAKVAPVIINRDPRDPDVRVTVPNVPIGLTLLQARGYDSLDGNGVRICTAESTCTVLLNDTVNVGLTMGTIATSVDIMGAPNVLIGHTTSLTATARDVDGVIILGPDFLWSCDDESLATVDQDGVVTGVARGTVTITCLERTSGKSDTHVVEVQPDISAIDVTPPTQTVNKDLTFDLTVIARILASPVPNIGFTFTSDDPNIAKVAKTGQATATVTGVALGETDIVVSQPYTAVTGICHVTVTENGRVDVIID